MPSPILASACEGPKVREAVIRLSSIARAKRAPFERPFRKRHKKADEKAAREAAAQKAADDAVRLLVSRFTEVELLTFCSARRIADYRFDEALKRVEIAAEALVEVG